MYKIIGVNRLEYGPVSLEQLRQWFNEGRVDADTLIQAEGTTGWKPLKSIPELSAAFGLAPATPPTAPPPPAASTSTPGTFRPPPTITGNVAPPSTNKLALGGFCFGILSLVLCWCCLGIFFSILGLVFSCVGLTQINEKDGRETGKGLAIAGIVLSGLGLLLQLHFLRSPYTTFRSFRGRYPW